MKRHLFCSFLAGIAGLGSALAERPLYEVIDVDSWWAGTAPFPGYVLAIGLTNQEEVLTTEGIRPDEGLRLWQNGVPLSAGYVPVVPGYDTPQSGNFVARGKVGVNGLKALDVVKADLDDPNNYLKGEYHMALADTRGLTIQTVPDPPGGLTDFAFPSASANAAFLTASTHDDTRAWRYDVVTSQWLEITTGGRWVTPNAVNDHGAVVGGLAVPGAGYEPFVYSDAGGLVEITNGTLALSGKAADINNNGLVTGIANGRAFVFNSNTMEFKYLSETVTGVRGVDINEAGAILGLSGSGESGFVTLWTEEMGLVSVSSLLEGNEDPFHPIPRTPSTGPSPPSISNETLLIIFFSGRHRGTRLRLGGTPPLRSHRPGQLVGGDRPVSRLHRGDWPDEPRKALVSCAPMFWALSSQEGTMPQPQRARTPPSPAPAAAQPTMTDIPRRNPPRASARGRPGTAIRPKNHPAIRPTHQLARNPISATNHRRGQPTSAQANCWNFIRVKYSGARVKVIWS
jgi:hypothetical protein